MPTSIDFSSSDWSVVDATLDNQAQDARDFGDDAWSEQLSGLRSEEVLVEVNADTVKVTRTTTEWWAIVGMLVEDAARYREIAETVSGGGADWAGPAEANARVAAHISCRLLHSGNDADAAARSLAQLRLASSSNHDDAEVGTTYLASSSVKMAWMRIVATDEDDEAKVALALHPDLPREITDLLARDPSERVRAALLRGPENPQSADGR